MMAVMVVIAFKPKPSRPAPRGTTGATGWLRAHLFYSWWSTILTLALGYLDEYRDYYEAYAFGLLLAAPVLATAVGRPPLRALE